MTEKKQPDFIELSIRRIGTKSFNFTDFGSSLNNDEASLNKDDFEFNLSFSIKPVSESKYIYVDFSVTLKEKNTTNEYCHLVIFIEFDVANFDEIINNDNGNIQVYNNAIPLFASVAIGTARGIFASYVSNTAFRDAILPVIDTGKFLNTATVTKHN